MISVIILTKDEEKDLPTCLASVTWSDDIHILDSGSSDGTVEIGKSFGASIWYNRFESFGKQRNFALDTIPTKNSWILFLDADEVVSPTFRDTILDKIERADSQVAGYYCCWKMMYEDKWLKNCDNFPKWQFRIVKAGMARFRDFGHGQKEEILQGRAEYIREPYLHYGFSKGWSHWLERHNKYSTQEASARLFNSPPLKDVFSRHGSIRNPAIKSRLSLLPGWPLIRFFHAYFINLGFMEGIPGLIYCINIGYYEFLIQIKMREIIKTAQGNMQHS